MFVLGLVALGYAFIETQNSRQKNKQIKTAYSRIKEIRDSVSISRKIDVIESNRVITNYSERHGINTSFSIDDTSFFEKTYSLGVNNKPFKDSVLVQYLSYIERSSGRRLLLNHYENEERLLDAEKAEVDSLQLSIYSSIVMGFLFLLPGYYGIYKQQVIQDDLLYAQLNNVPIKYDRCQSCGQKFSSIIKPGKDLDGAENKSFCNDCYNEGIFKEPDLTLNEIIRRATNDIPRKKYAAKKLTALLRNLDRWKIDNYS